ncbi:hypothetical protein [Blastococcus brunescens]|uniref:Uncharacterized protein n=1 Tax=Blastococcus brunescens TaxID=1564165 RepID=A0ABZ1BA59_9ACTN|nr:hypothetical protein [Blastococcus sp. BMG 8361]WRL67367.1 hypothetical protein U6N30_11555 [Blastococcus sp. BMG 8361]
MEVFLQVDLGGEPGGTAPRGGALPADVPALADHVVGAAGLRLRGLMAVAPRGRTRAAPSTASPPWRRGCGPTIPGPSTCPPA